MLRQVLRLVVLACLSSNASPAAAMAAGIEPDGGPPLAEHRAPSKPHRLYAGTLLGGGGWGTADNDGFGTLGLSLGGYPRPGLRVDGTVTYDDIAFLPESTLGRAFRDAEAEEIGLDLTARYDPRGDRARVHFYPLVGVGAGTMFWHYANPVTVAGDGGSRLVGYDGIFYVSFYGGGGVSVAVTPHVSVGASLSGGVRSYDQNMGSGARNALLRTTGFGRFLLDVNWRLR